jgi:lipoprotein-releasing system ATP-binding protein
MSEATVRAKGVVKTFVDGASRVEVLRGVDFEARKGQSVALVGASGSGKSTLLHLLGGLDTPTSGTISIAGREWVAMDEAARGLHRNRNLGFVYQFHHLLAEFTALENVAMPLLIRRMPRAQAFETARSWLDAVGLAHRIKHAPGELSGGERQRVAVARALVTQPACVLADEPTGNLDRENAENVFALMLDLARKHGTTFVMATHDERLAVNADRMVRLVGGRVQT